MIAISKAAGSTIGTIGAAKKLGIMSNSFTQPRRKKKIDITVPILERHDHDLDPVSVWSNRGRRGVRSL